MCVRADERGKGNRSGGGGAHSLRQQSEIGCSSTGAPLFLSLFHVSNLFKAEILIFFHFRYSNTTLRSYYGCVFHESDAAIHGLIYFIFIFFLGGLR